MLLSQGRFGRAVDDLFRLGKEGGGTRGVEGGGSHGVRVDFDVATLSDFVSLVREEWLSITFLRSGGGRSVCERFLPLACPRGTGILPATCFVLSYLLRGGRSSLNLDYPGRRPVLLTKLMVAWMCLELVEMESGGVAGGLRSSCNAARLGVQWCIDGM